MTSGVYLLDFGGAQYVGKSCDIDRRWAEHVDTMRKGRAAQKLQMAYNRWGAPARSILVECHRDHIDLLETIMIRRLKPSLNSAQTVAITLDDIYTISDSCLLGDSTGQHLRTIEELEAKISTLNMRVSYLESSNTVNDLALAHERMAYLEREHNKPWWKKLL